MRNTYGRDAGPVHEHTFELLGVYDVRCGAHGGTAETARIYVREP